MPAPVYRSNTKPLSASINRLRDALHKDGIKLQAYATAVAGLGCIGIIEERDEAERHTLVKAGKALGPWTRAWREVYEAEGQQGLRAWIQAQRDDIRACPYSSAELRTQVLDALATWDEHVPLGLAARMQLSYMKSEDASMFDFHFIHHWKEVGMALEQDSEASRYEVREEFRYVLQQLADIQPGQRALLIQTTGAVLLREIMEALQKRGSQDCLAVQCANTPEDLFALATMLACGVERPSVTFVEIDHAPDRARYDWVICLDQSRERDDTPDWCPVQSRNQSGCNIAMQRAMLSLASQGRALVLSTRSFCQTKQSDLRHWLLSNYRLDAVIHLSGGRVWPSMGFNFSLLCLRCDKPSSTAWFVDDRLYDARFHEKGIAGREHLSQAVVLAPIKLAMVPTKQMMSLDADHFRLQQELRAGLGKQFNSSQDMAIYEFLLAASLTISQEGIAAAPATRLATLDGTGAASIFAEKPLVGPVVDELSLALLNIREQQLDIPVVKLGDIAAIKRGHCGHSFGRGDWGMSRNSFEQAAANGLEACGAILSAKDLPDNLPLEFATKDDMAPRLPTALLNHLPAGISDEAKLRIGDVLIAETAQRQFRVAVFNGVDPKVAEIIGADGGVYASDKLLVIRLKDPQLATYIALLLQLYAQSHLRAISSAALNAYILRAESLATLQVPIPDGDASRSGLSLSDWMTFGIGLSHAVVVNYQKTSLHLFASATISAVSKLASPDASHDLDSTIGILKAAAETIRGWLSNVPETNDSDYAQEPEREFEQWWRQVLPKLDELIELLQELKGVGLYTGVQTWLGTSLNLIDCFPFGFGCDTSVTFKDDALKHKAINNGRDFLYGLRAVARKCCEPTINVVTTASSIAPNVIPVGVSCILMVSLQNANPLPLRRVQLTISGNSSEPMTLNGNESATLPFEFTADKAGVHPLMLRWSAKRLDGEIIHGESELAVQAIEGLADGDKLELGTNPYVDARTLQDTEDRVFFGRERELARLRDELAKPSASTVLLVEGNRRTGKTSLLHHFMAHQLPANWIAADCSFQSGEGEDATPEHGARRGIPTREVFYTLARGIVYAVVRAGVRVELDGLGDVDPSWRPVKILRRVTDMLYPYFQGGPAYARLCIVLDQCLEAMGERRLLLIIDEFDRLQEGIDSGVTSDQVPENIRHLFQTYNQLAGILTGSRKIRRLREQYWNVLFGIGDPLILRGLEPKAVRDLIIKPVEGRLTYVPAAVERLAFITAGQPRILQSLCSRLFDLCVAEKQGLITEALVNRVADEKARDYEHFKVLWSAIESPVHQFVALIIDRMVQRGDAGITFDLIHDEAEACGIDLENKALEAALSDLVDLEITSEQLHNSRKHYGIEIPLLSDWLRHNQDIDKVKLAAQQLLNP